MFKQINILLCDVNHMKLRPEPLKCRSSYFKKSNKIVVTIIKSPGKQQEPYCYLKLPQGDTEDYFPQTRVQIGKMIMCHCLTNLF